MYYNIVIDRPVGDFSHRFKCYGAIAALLGTAMNAAYQDKQNEENRQAQNDMLTRQENFQRELNANSALVQMQSLKKAGLSPNLLSGNPAYNATASLGDSSSQQAPQIDVSAVSSLLQQQPLVDAQARKDNAEAEAQEIENKRMRSEDAQYSAEDALDVYNQLSEEEKVKQGLPPVVIVPRNKGWFEAHRNFNQLKGERSDVSLRQFSNAFNEAIVKRQLANESVLEALENMPYRQYMQIVELTNLAIAQASESRANKEYIDSNKAYIDLKKKLEEDGNIFPYISKLFNGSFDFEDFVKCLVLVGMKVASR